VVGIPDEPVDALPVHLHVEVDADPATVSDVRRQKVARWLSFDERIAHTGRSRAPQRDAVVVVVIG